MGPGITISALLKRKIQMGIKNRNIEDGAQISMAKLALTKGPRVFWDDFDDTSITDIGSQYGFNLNKTGSADAPQVADNSVVEMYIDGNNEVLLISQDSHWSNAKECTMEALISRVNRITNIEIRVGFASAAQITAMNNMEDADKDWAYIELDTGTATDWAVRSKIASGTETVTRTGIIPGAGTDDHELKVRLTASEGVIATIGDREIFHGTNVVTDKTDWQPFVYVKTLQAGATTVWLDSFAAYENRRA